MKKYYSALSLIFIGIQAKIPEPIHTKDIHKVMMATIEQSKGNIESAQQWYDDIMQSDNPSVYINKGYLSLLSKRGDFKKITELLPKLDTHFANDADVQLIFITALQKTGAIAQADERLISLAQKFKTHPEIIFHTVEALVRRKDHKNALLYIDDYLSHAPRRANTFIFYFTKAQILSQLREFKTAKECIEKCLALHRKFPQGWLLFALISEQTGELKNAITSYRSYLEIAGSNTQIEQHLMQLMLKQKALEKTKTILNTNQNTFEKAIILYGRKHHADALQNIESFLSQNPQHIQGRLLKIQILTDLKKLDDSIRLLTAWSIQEPDAPMWLQALHLLYRIDTSPHEKIITAFESIHLKNPDKLLPLLYIADLHTRHNNTKESLIHLRKAVVWCKDPELKTRILYQIALAEHDAGNEKAMAQTLENALALGMDYPPVNNLLAYHYAIHNDLKKAEELCLKAINKDKNNPHFLDTKAFILFQQEKYSEALRILVPVAKAAPHDSTILTHLAQTYKQLGKLKQAQKTLKKANQYAHNSYEIKTITDLQLLWSKQS